MRRLQGQCAIITGAGTGIGLAIAERFIAEGADVIGCIRDESEAANLPPAVATVVGDVTEVSSHQALLDCALERYGRLDCLVSNAGTWDFHKRLAKIDADEITKAFDAMMHVNVLGLLLGARVMHQELAKNRGSIIATASNASFLAGGGGALYTASKFALRGAVMQLAKEFAPDVRVNAVAPGATDTSLKGPEELGLSDRSMNADPAKIEAIGPHVPMGRVSSAADHAALYVTLACRAESPYVTGATFLSDGGLTIAT